MNNSELNKEVRLSLKKKLQRVIDLMIATNRGYRNREHQSYRWLSLKNIKFRLQNELEPYELELLIEYQNSDTHKFLQGTKNKSGFKILMQA